MSRMVRITYVTMEPEESEPVEVDLPLPEAMFETTVIAGQETTMGPSIGQLRQALAESLGRNDVEIVRVAL